ncbi:hypothetical protein [Maricaulis sp.]|uniref:hypothetical protein n=1 Tax=Maricaulis sp. TaxID=1486257 RepID=UPI0025BA01E1|nr:hypothetical protein [Maricaulis sp.]
MKCVFVDMLASLVDPVDMNGNSRHALGLLEERVEGRERLFINPALVDLLPHD